MSVRPKTITNGIIFKPPNNVRVVNPRPWSNYTLQYSLPHKDDAPVTLEGVYRQLATNAGLFKDQTRLSLEIKIRSVEVYGVTDQTLACRFFNLSASHNVEQYEQSFPAKNQFSRIGYIWPLSDQSVVFNSDTDGASQVITVYGTSKDDRCVIRFRVLYRSATALYQTEVLDFRPNTVSCCNRLSNQEASASCSPDILSKLDRLCDLLDSKMVL